MSEMVERVARKLCELNHSNPDRLEPGNVWGIDGYMPNGDPAHFMWRNFVDRARAVIEAMRQPTETMARAPTALADWEDSCAEVVWDAMIDAALK